jgi:hypothetical protein
MTGFKIHQGPVRAGVTFLVAASDASGRSKARADYVCNGTNDQEQMFVMARTTRNKSGMRLRHCQRVAVGLY